MLIFRLCHHFIETKCNRNWENRVISMKSKKIKYGRHLVDCTHWQWWHPVIGSWRLGLWWQILCERFGRKGPMLCLWFCYVIWTFTGLHVLLAFHESIHFMYKLRNFFPFIYLNHFFNKENFSCEIIGCYVYLLVVLRKSSTFF